MNIVPKNKEHELLLRVFKMIEDSHFNDSKLSVSYVVPVRMKRSLGDDIGNWVQSHYGKFYHEKRRKAEAELRELRERQKDAPIVWYEKKL